MKNEPCFYRVSVKGIVIDEEGRMLLTCEDNGKWELLGGGLDHGEDPIDGLKREIREETGLTVTKVSDAPMFFVTAKRIDGANYLANVIYQIELADLNFTPSEECQELRFFSLQEMGDLVANGQVFSNVEKLYELLSKR